MSTIEKIVIPESIIVEFEAIVPREGTVPVENKSVTITENGSHEVTANPNTVMSKVDITVDVEGSLPISNKEVSYTENGTFEVTADEGTTMNNVTVEVDVPQKEVKDKDVEYTSNGSYTVNADSDTVMQKVNIKVDVPSSPSIETQVKSITIRENGSHTVSADEGKAMTEVDIEVNIPQPKIEGKRTVRYTDNDTYQITPQDGFNAIDSVEVEVDVPQTILVEREETIEENGEYEYIPNSGSAYSKVKVKVEVPAFGDLIKAGMPADLVATKEADYQESIANSYLVKDTMTLSEINAIKNKLVVLRDTTIQTAQNQNFTVNSLNLLYVGNITVTWNAITQMFNGCSNLMAVGNISSTTNIASASNTFNGCASLRSLGILQWKNITATPQNTFNGCGSLVDFGGIIGLKVNLSLSPSANLSAKSVRNIMYHAEAVTAARTLTLHATAKANFLAECETNEEYAQVYDDFINVKGWTLA